MVYVKQHNVYLSTISNNNKKKKKIYYVQIVMNHESEARCQHLDRVTTNLEYSGISTKIEDSGNS